MPRTKPELLSPAGSKDALDAAIRAGADAVYFGGNRFNARMSADNFDDRAMEEAIRTCAFYGVKSNITLNTLLYERELADALRYAERLCRMGADAIICADLALARAIHTYFPELALHASTQCMGHNTDAARALSALGFSRMVCARELSSSDIRTLCKNSPIEIEMFLHGAMCVSQSGGCLFSSLVGSRSGNRGACAQPCRLPYTVTAGNRTGKEGYPLSLRDMSLACHMTELLSLGAASFKIEGRMKSPAYVYGVTSIYRRLIDEDRNADAHERSMLASLFSRGGTFADGYFMKKTHVDMQGVRTEQDKNATARAEKAVLSGRQEVRRRGVALALTVGENEAPMLCLTSGDIMITVKGEVTPPTEDGMTAPNEERIRQNLQKLGSTPFFAQHVSVTIKGAPFFPVSAVNALRRMGAEALEAAIRARAPIPKRVENAPLFETKTPVFAVGEVPFVPYAARRQARFLSCAQIPPSARDGYDILYLPLEAVCRDIPAALDRGISGVILPPVIFDSEANGVRAMLERARAGGMTEALVSNLGHAALAAQCGYTLHGDLRLNLYSAAALSALLFAAEAVGARFADVLLSPELSLAQLRDIRAELPRGVVTYGRLPLMTLERCILRESAGKKVGGACNLCDRTPVSYLCDRVGASFPITRTYPHRNTLWNSAVLYMADKPNALAAMQNDFVHHIFTVETPAEIELVIASEQGAPLQSQTKDGISVPYRNFPRIKRIR